MTESRFLPLGALLALTPLQVAACSLLVLPVFLLSNYLYTSLQFRRAVTEPVSKRKSSPPRSPPYLPYAIPWLGNTLTFLDTTPGRFWTSLRSRLGHHQDVCTILLGGIPTYILAGGVDGLLKPSTQKITDRDRFNEIVMKQGFGTGNEDYAKFHRTAFEIVEGGKGKLNTQDSIYHEYMLAPAQVNILTGKFVETLRAELAKLDVPTGGTTIDFVRIIRDAMFTASTTAFLGSKVLELCPNWGSDFWAFDAEMLKLFYGFPKFMTEVPQAALERLLDASELWQREAYKNYDAETSKDLDWEPWYGSRFSRARYDMCLKAGLSDRGRVCQYVGFLFGLSSNAIPATTWIICHILTSDDKTLLPDLLAEVVTAQRPDGFFDINKLVQQPLLNSVYSETLRVYVDLLVSRTINETFTLPSSHPGHAGHVLKKGNVAMAPTYISHRDPTFWSDYGESAPGADVWYARRFMHEGKFSTVGTANKFFPYGGGHHMCPGRTFAKQEILVAVAIILTTFNLALVEGETMPPVKKAYNGAGVVGMDKGLMVKITRK